MAVAKVVDDREALLACFDYPAEGRWRAVNGPHLVALVRAGGEVREGQAGRATQGGPEEEINEVAA